MDDGVEVFGDCVCCNLSTKGERLDILKVICN